MAAMIAPAVGGGSPNEPVPPVATAAYLGRYQFEALITTAWLSTNPTDVALIALLGLRGAHVSGLAAGGRLRTHRPTGSRNPVAGRFGVEVRAQ